MEKQFLAAVTTTRSTFNNVAGEAAQVTAEEFMACGIENDNGWRCATPKLTQTSSGRPRQSWPGKP